MGPPEDNANLDEQARSQGVRQESLAKFQDHKTSFAIDCSGSTLGPILLSETVAIESMAGLLSENANKVMNILPWNHAALGKVDIQTLRTFHGNGGTDPTVLLSNRAYKSSLKDASLWVLLTDGEIGQQLVEQFAVGLCSAGLHGTSCIIMLFGPTTRPPAQCNISVGQAVFAVSPNCLFLYRDTDSGTIYVLQYKGSFRTALQREKGGIALDKGVRWKELPTFDFSSLRDLDIQNPVTLERDHIVLPNGLQFSMKDIYRDSLDPKITREIFSNNENLNTVVLTGMTRGREIDVQRWIARQTIKRDDPLWTQRTDIQGNALRLVEQLVDIQAAGGTSRTTIETVQHQLRSAYKRNWEAFAERVNAQEIKAKQRDVVIREVSDHISASTCGDDDDRFSSSTLSRPSRSLAGWEDERYETASRDPTKTGRAAELLYLPGYEVKASRDGYRGRHSQSDGLRGLCELCGGRDRVLCLLLKAPPADMSTHGFPPAGGDRPRQRYPLALGNYPETDIIAPSIFCDACSYSVLQLGKKIDGNKITAALALCKLTLSVNQNSWATALDTAFQERFHQDDLLLIFLAVVYSSINHLASLDEGNHTFVIHALKWASNNLINTADIPLELSATPEMFSNVDLITVKSFLTVVPDRLARFGPEDWAFLTYPLDGFEVFIHALCHIETTSGPEDVRRLVWLRLLFSLTEQFHQLQVMDGTERATISMSQLLSAHSALEPEGKDPITISSLHGTMIQDSELSCFQKMPPFAEIVAKGSQSLTIFMNALTKVDKQYDSPTDLFEELKSQFYLDRIFRSPFA
jgi:hypothetical protein